MPTSETSQGGLWASSYAEEQEHAIVGGVAAKKVFPIVLPPTAQTNPSLVLTYDGSNQITNIALTIGATTYNKTLTWVAGNCTAVSVWT